MVELLQEIEAAPETYPNVMPYAHTNFDPPLDQDAAVPSAMIWQRIEAHVAHRWTPREVVWIVRGPGEWTPRLTPATVTAQEVWDGSAWIAASLSASPLGGYELAGEGPYRLTATVGGGDVPEAVQEAFRRLHEYARGIAESWRNETAIYRSDGGQTGSQAVASWAGKAIQLSGAADLLRPYRRA